MAVSDWEDDMSFLTKKFPEWDLLLKWDITSIRGYVSDKAETVHVVFKRRGNGAKRPKVIKSLLDVGNDWAWFVKKEIHVQAAQLTEDALIPTLEGTMKAGKGWWVVKGIKGELYAVRPDIFAETFVRKTILDACSEINSNGERIYNDESDDE